MAEELPLILAGPILRRATPEAVSIWIATRFDPSGGIKATLQDKSKRGKDVLIPTTTEHRYVSLGSVYINLVTVRPSVPEEQGLVKVARFPTATLVGYDLTFQVPVPPGGTFEERSLGELVEMNLLSYPGVGSPSFFLTKSNASALNVLHGSCRKPAGDGDDALAAADSLLARSARDLDSRPAALVLTGDQIYAADMYAPMLHDAHFGALDLCGQERMPLETVQEQYLSDYAIKNRKKLVNGVARFTTDDGGWHLLGMSEFSFVYLMSWGDGALWKNFREVVDTDGDDKHKRAASFFKSLPTVRRALANVPVYMIFDDNDVTDDWNLHQEWQTATMKSPLGRRVILNGLVAYFLFQGWGNDPERFDAAFLKVVQDYCQSIFLFDDSSGRRRKAIEAAEHQLLRWKTGRPTASLRSLWSYFVPTYPPIFVLDSRTERTLLPRGTAPAIVSALGRDHLRFMLNAAGREGYRIGAGLPLILVQAAPLYGVPFALELQGNEIQDSSANIEVRDFEQWQNNTSAHRSFSDFVSGELKVERLLVLSGDVHYASTCRARIGKAPLDPAKCRRAEYAAATPPLTVLQVTSSPLKNMNSLARDAKTIWPGSFFLEWKKGVAMNSAWQYILFASRTDFAIRDWEHIHKLRLRPYDLFAGKRGPWIVPHWHNLPSSLAVALREPIAQELGEFYVHAKGRADPPAVVPDGDAPWEYHNNIGLVRVERSKVTHALHGVLEVGTLAPRIWGPESVTLRW
jgi:hypothetical protein